MLVANFPLPQDKKSYAREQILNTWGNEEWKAFDLLIQKESGWNHLAQNPNSTAFGYAQFLNSTWKMVGCTKTIDKDIQIDCAIKYIKVMYTTPTKALDFHYQHNWY